MTPDSAPSQPPAEGQRSNEFRKKPIVIQAWQWTEKNSLRLRMEAEGLHSSRWDGHVESPDLCRNLRIRTLEGDMTVGSGDWIIKGVKGEFYPCKPDVFEASYELADGPDSSAALRLEVERLKADALILENNYSVAAQNEGALQAEVERLRKALEEYETALIDGPENCTYLRYQECHDMALAALTPQSTEGKQP